MRARFDKEDVIAELRSNVELVLSSFSWKFRKRGSQFRGNDCPRCGDSSSSEAVVVSGRDGRWIHFGHDEESGGNCNGDVVDLVAAFAGIDKTAAKGRDFEKVLEAGARIVGLEPRSYTDAERVQRRARQAIASTERDRLARLDDERECREAKIRASAFWRGMLPQTWNADGDAHLRSRGFGGRAIRQLIEGDYVRCNRAGDLCVGLYANDGDLINVVRRVRLPMGPKVLGVDGCTTAGSIVGRIRDIRKTDTIICEGVVDAITAVVLWPESTVLGANGAGRLRWLVGEAASRVVAEGGRMLINPHRDTAGMNAAAKAITAAVEAGLVMGQSLLVVNFGEHKDLNDAFKAGWKP